MSNQQAVKKVAVIDLGYNSLKMVLYEVAPDGNCRAYSQKGELVKLGEGLDRTRGFSRESINRTLGVLEMFREIINLEKVDKVLAFATSAVREATNGGEFVREAEKVVKMRFRILGWKEEALFSYVGAAKAIRHKTMLFFDLGGGTLELTYAEDRQVKIFLSLPLGALRMSELYGVRGAGYLNKNYDQLREKIGKLLPSRKDLGIRGDTVLVGVGGTVRALAKHDQSRTGYPLNKVHNYVLKRKTVMATHKMLREMNPDKISHMDAFGKDRSESITTGSLIVAIIMDKLDFGSIVVSTHGLRDGVVEEYVRDPRAYSHSDYTEKMANSALLVDRKPSSITKHVHSLATLGILSNKEEYVLVEALDRYMESYRTCPPETLFYQVITQDSILEHQEQLAAVLALIRAKAPKIARWYFEMYASLLKDIERKSIYRMAAVVQLTDILNQSSSDADFRLKDNLLQIEIEAGKANEFPSLLLERAIKQLQSATGLEVQASQVRGHFRNTVA